MKHTTISGLILACLLVGAAPASAQELNIGIRADPGSLDPATNGTFVGRIALQMFCDKLVDIDDKGNVIPMLATAWKWSDDGKTLTMDLRHDVKFQDGEPFNAEAVRYNIDRYKTLESSRRARNSRVSRRSR